MAFGSAIKKSNISENWIFQFAFYNGDANGNGEGGFEKITQSDGSLNLLNEDLDSSDTGVAIDDNTVFQVGDFIKIDNEVMKVLSFPITGIIGVQRGVRGTTATSHSNNTQLFWDNYIGISFKNVTHNDVFYHGVILNSPSIRESIDLVSSTSKSSNMSLQIPDFKFNNKLISEELFGASEKYINQIVKAFIIVDSDTPIQVGSFRFVDISTNGKTLNLSLVTQRPWDNITIPQAKTSKNNYFPIAYGNYTPNDTVRGSEDFCPSQDLYPCPVEQRNTLVLKGLQPQSISSEARLHFYEKEIDSFIPLTKSDNTYRDTAVSDGNGHSTLVDNGLFRGFWTKGFKEEATSISLFSDGSLAVDNRGVSQGSGTNSTADIVSGVRTSSFDDTKSLVLETPNITGTVSLAYQRFRLKHTGTILQDNIQLTGSSTLTGYGTNTTLNTINYATEVEPSTPEVDNITTTSNELTLSNGQLPVNYGLNLRLQGNALGGQYNISTDCDVYDAQILINANLDFANNREGAYQTIDRIKFLYCGANGLKESFSGSNNDISEIHDAHRDLLIRFAGMTTDTPDGYSSLDSARSGWDLRYWILEEELLEDTLNKLAYEGGFIFRFKGDGSPQYIHIPNSPTTEYILSKDDISKINISSSKFSDLVTKRIISFEKHPAENRYISTLTTEDTTNDFRRKFNIKTKENIQEIKLDALVANVGDANCGNDNRNDSFAGYYNKIDGSIKTLVSCEIVNPKYYDIEVGSIIEFDENNMFPESAFGVNSSTWNNLQMIVTSTNRTIGKMSITLREI